MEYTENQGEKDIKDYTSIIPNETIEEMKTLFKKRAPLLVLFDSQKKNYDFINCFLQNTYTLHEIDCYIEDIYKKNAPKITTCVSVLRLLTSLKSISVQNYKYTFLWERAVIVIHQYTYKKESTSTLSWLASNNYLCTEAAEYLNKYRWVDFIKYRKQWITISNEKIYQLINQAANECIKNREVFSKTKILNKLYHIDSLKSSRLSTDFFRDLPNSQFFDDTIHECYIRVNKELLNNTYSSMKLNSNNWTLFYMYRDSLQRFSLDFSKLPPNIKINLQKIMKLNYTETRQYAQYYYNITLDLSRLCELFEIYDYTDISIEHLFLLVQSLREKEYSINTIRQIIIRLRSFFEKLKEFPQYSNMRNPAKTVSIHNAHKNYKHTPFIPPEIRAQLYEHIDELPPTYRLIFKVLDETGDRFGEVACATIDDIKPELREDGQTYGIFYFDEGSKTVEYRIQKDINPQQFNYISPDLYKEILSYVNNTRVTRNKYNTKLLFFQISVKGRLCHARPRTLNSLVNKLMKKYNIKTIDGKQWNYITKQSRKTVASDLVSNGASLSNVQNQLHHMSQQTTEIYYAEVNNEMILNKNTQFFRRKFTLFASEETLSNYTEEERAILYLNFLNDQREVELGKCCKKMSEGTCSTNNDYLCINCTKLITGKKYLPKWLKLFETTQKRVLELEEIYKKHNIPHEEYINYREYNQELTLMRHYEAVINKINEIEEQ